ncbi:ATP-binding protein [Haloglomus litoreum]|uniref:ATP-binding protein n=1 Tax=Haloglomus litoreum TaxID=3034026 RepID=UPI0023E75F14|nr:ATP-binding protein [Haloglomus sp. DT116]
MAKTGTTHESHQYLRIRPANEPLAADRLTAQFTQLHEAIDTPIEFCLTVDPNADEIAYYVGAPPDSLPTVRRLVQRLTPDDYAITDPDTNPLPDPDDHDCTVAELQGIGERRQDWQTRLRPPQLSDAPEQHDTARVEDAPDLALGSVAEGMLDADGRVVYQVLLRPKPDWSAEAEYRVRQLEHDEDTLSQRAFKTLVGPTDPDDRGDDSTTTPAHLKGDTGSRPGTRIDAILAKSSNRSFEVNGRLLTTGPNADATARELASGFAAVGGDFYRVGHRLHTDDEAADLAEAITNSEFREADSLTSTLRKRLPLGSNCDPSIVADATTVAHFCLLDGSELSEQARRAFSTLPEERTGIQLPDEHTLAHYDDPGLPIGHPLTTDSTALDRTLSLPPALQPLHVAWFGKTGAGKSTSLVNAILENQHATDGADILIDPKGDGMPAEYLRAHYADHGDLDDVYYFDCADTLPALSFFDIRPQLEAGISRASAVQNVVDHYVEVLRGVMGTERFEQAVRSPDIIRYLVKALFDPVHGSDAYTHADLQAAVQQLRSTRQPPEVSDPELEAMLEGIVANNERSFSELLQGVANRIEKIPLDYRLNRVFNHTHGDGPAFDFHDVLDEDAVVLFDLGGLRTESQRVLTLVLLSNLWTALKRRERAGTGDQPLVNLYLEEAADVAATDLLSDLLAQSRSFGLSMTLAMQFPAQLQQADADAYTELLNNVSTIVTGNVAVDDQLATRFATAEMPPEDVGNRLRALERGQWFVSLPAPFGEAEPRPFLVESLPLPPGHPEGPEPLAPAETTGFDALFTAVAERTKEHHGLTIETDTATATATAETADATDRVDSALPFTETLPEPVRYDEERHALRCESCEARYEPTSDGMRRAIDCCHALADIDREAIPVCRVPLKLSAAERAASEYSDQQLLFLQAVYAASQQRFDPEVEFDFLTDSMKRLVEYLGLEDAALQELTDDGLLRHDGNRPHKLYTVTAAGRDEIGERHREGIAHGDGEGDLAESSLHAMMVACGARYIEQEYAADPDSPVVEAVRYHPVGDGRRLDAAGLDADGEVVVALEAERLNHNPRRNVPADFDAMAACDPEAALWVTENREAAHEVLGALNDPLEGEPRVEKTYSENSPPRQWKIDTAGFTDALTLGRVRNQM